LRTPHDILANDVIKTTIAIFLYATNSPRHVKGRKRVKRVLKLANAIQDSFAKTQIAAPTGKHDRQWEVLDFVFKIMIAILVTVSYNILTIQFQVAHVLAISPSN
jgi:hypothetical protein